MTQYISTTATIELINENDVSFLEAYQNYTKIRMINNNSILGNESLKKHEETFGENFIRVHNSFILNLTKVKRYYKVGEVELECGTKIPVSRRKRNFFLERLLG